MKFRGHTSLRSIGSERARQFAGYNPRTLRGNKVPYTTHARSERMRALLDAIERDERDERASDSEAAPSAKEAR